MPKVQPPELKSMVNNKLTSPSGMVIASTQPPFAVKLNSNRQVTGVLLGFDAFMNIVLDKAIDDKLRQDLGVVVIRGNSIITIENQGPADQ